MPSETESLKEMQDKLKDAIWADLSRKKWDQISLETVADDLLIDPMQARLAAGSKTKLVLDKLSELDRQALAESHEDFSEDPDATMHDKLLEGSLHRFEIYQLYKSQIRHLHAAAMRDPKLGMKLIASLKMTVDQLLFICGDKQPSLQRHIRLKGLTALLMSVRSDWLVDDSSDMAKTAKILDKRLKQAAEWAESFRIV